MTPTLCLDRLDRSGQLWAKDESQQPTGSIKDRVAAAWLEDRPPGEGIIAASSGNLGIALAVACQEVRPCEIVVPAGTGHHFRRRIEAAGATCTPVGRTATHVTEDDLRAAARVARRHSPGRFWIDTWDDAVAIEAHRLTTGPELLDAVPDLAAFVAAVGSGGSFLGVRGYLGPSRRCVAALADGPIHGVVGRLPEAVTAEVERVSDREATAMVRRLRAEEGLDVGPSSGANVVAALRLIAAGVGPVVTLLPDAGDRYR